MSKYWIRIGLGALLVFGFGYGAWAMGRRVVHRVKSDSDLTIPLLGIVPFTLDGDKLGSFRSLTIRRKSPGQVTGFELRARLEDTAALERVRNCKLSVGDPTRVNEHTTFSCLTADSGYQPFGEIRLSVRVGNDTRTVIQPLLVPDSVAEELRRKEIGSIPGSSYGDSIAAEVRARIRSQARSMPPPKP